MTAPDGEVLLRARGLRKVYGSKAALVTAVDRVDLDIPAGGIYVLMGLSGSGKSTVLRMLNRLITPTEGTVELQGEDLSTLGRHRLRDLRNRRMSMVFQHFALFPHRSVRENAAYGLRVRGESKAVAFARADESLAAVGLERWGDARPRQLSGGMQQRVGLARALTTDADILLMDEPFSALDPLIRSDMQDLLLKLAGDLGRTVVFVTHDLNEAMRLGDTITLLNQGKVAQTGSVVDILTRPADDYVARFVGEVDRSRILTARDIMAHPHTWSQPAPPVSVSADQTLAQVAARVGSSGSAAVLDDRREVVGYVTAGTVLAALAEAAA